MQQPHWTAVELTGRTIIPHWTGPVWISATGLEGEYHPNSTLRQGFFNLLLHPRPQRSQGGQYRHPTSPSGWILSGVPGCEPGKTQEFMAPIFGVIQSPQLASLGNLDSAAIRELPPTIPASSQPSLVRHRLRVSGFHPLLPRTSSTWHSPANDLATLNLRPMGFVLNVWTTPRTNRITGVYIHP